MYNVGLHVHVSYCRPKWWPASGTLTVDRKQAEKIAQGRKYERAWKTKKRVISRYTWSMIDNSFCHNTPEEALRWQLIVFGQQYSEQSGTRLLFSGVFPWQYQLATSRTHCLCWNLHFSRVPPPSGTILFMHELWLPEVKYALQLATENHDRSISYLIIAYGVEVKKNNGARALRYMYL